MSLHPRLGGSTWMASIAPFGDVQRSFGSQGCLLAQFAYSPSPGSSHTALSQGALLDLVDDAGVDWSGVVTEIDPVGGFVYAHGHAAEAARFQAVGGGGLPTSNPYTAASNAAALGWLVTLDASIPNTPYTADADGANTVAALLEAQSNELGVWWSVDAERVLRIAGADSSPIWQVPPGVVDLGAAGDEYVSALRVTYLSGTSTTASVLVTDDDAASRFGYREEPVDATTLGIIDSTRAQTLGEGLLAKGRSRLGWNTSVELSRYDLLTMGGVPADLSLVRSFQMVRIHGIDDDLQDVLGQSHLDVVIGEAAWLSGSETIGLSPLGAVAQSHDEFIAKLAGAA